MIRIVNLRHRIVDIPDLAVDARHVAVIGPNGSGKTTLLSICSGIEEPRRGTVRLLGRAPAAVKIGWVGEFPDRTLLFSRAYDEIASSPRFRHRPCLETDERVRAAAGTIGIPHLLDAKVSALSGGEKALVALAAAVVDDPEVLILDEADSHLDGGTAARIQAAVKKSTAAHVLWCTQSMDTAAEADYVVFMAGGAVRHHGTPEEVFTSLEETCFYPTMWRIRR
ncbi:MAG TPA: energy-coupling factor ABC transporter ATP-binding protein [Methanoculleus sp.]|jgi:energy-coupling factor transport system ATP-binding protein|uniref:energy-coupling factor ABC transporter ATP-binding protein n=2 Tax=Methanoculleus sp. TaxID=90427 RepID=UPI000A9E087C|nr:energy-coupling factor ABC transporter ATP-binding protein [Methanoculleus sp.]HNV38219.1 energy-coupling factor ABC transporter ATP-binding protein [Methanoculleus sp.]HOI62529.1 energy-coupling factor ABC transporter ATP-binding protein [Methanoculleus sp.]HOS67645.1 energy-coupling factor ABC transporter ATP-binding protein [Methanoculleus sp.]HOZ43772.1 energy-coupling factor ABC transporter ATP-binding protein [Methanoculleus sp.]HQL59817.1 energy-coupling factor ABC transporter ATP-bi